ncbi:MAG: serine--tRNA ligase [Proteobacteria bacterium]|nr:serine--tRNA ligase [Pseudomonadota bacterium]
MLDIKFIRDNSDLVKKGARDKRNSIDIDLLLKLDADIRPKKTEIEQLQAERNRLSKEIGKASPDQRESMKSQVADIKLKMEQIEKTITESEAQLQDMLLLVPQPARSDVPIGKDDSENVEIKKWGTPPQFSFTPKDHVELGLKLGLVDFERGVRIAGSRSYVLTGLGARLEQAVLRYVYDKLCNKGYTPMSIPVLVREDCMTGTGYFPTGRDQAYYVEKDELALVGTAEVPLTSYYAGEILPEEKLPLKMMAWSSCFRREAGTYGKDTSGLYRVHQFQKIEQVIIGESSVEQSEKYHAELLQNAEECLQAFGIPYRVVYVCTGDLGQGQVRKHDIESWMPSRKNYGETHSCSTFHEFQARRLKLRYKGKDGVTKICHTLNNTAIASPRVLISLLEVHQRADGSIGIPECLQPYMGGMKEIR